MPRSKSLKCMTTMARKTQERIISLHKQMLKVLENFQSPHELVLLKKDFLPIKGIRYHNCVPKPEFIISGLEIVARMGHNNCFDERANCGIELLIKLDIDYATEDERRVHNNDQKPEWFCHFCNFKMRTETSSEKKVYGIISRPTGDWDNEIIIYNLSQFEKMKKVIDSFCKKKKLEIKDETYRLL